MTYMVRELSCSTYIEFRNKILANSLASSSCYNPIRRSSHFFFSTPITSIFTPLLGHHSDNQCQYKNTLSYFSLIHSCTFRKSEYSIERLKHASNYPRTLDAELQYKGRMAHRMMQRKSLSTSLLLTILDQRLVHTSKIKLILKLNSRNIMVLPQIGKYEKEFLSGRLSTSTFKRWLLWSYLTSKKHK